MPKRIITLLLPLLLAPSLRADPGVQGGEFDSSRMAAVVQESGAISLRANYSYTFESDFDRASLGSLSLSRFNTTARVPIQLTERLRLQTGATYRRLDFDADAGLVPDQMQGLAALVGLEYLINGIPVAGLQAAPGFYFIDDIESDTFNVPTLAYAGWRFSDKFVGIVGATYSGLRDDNKVIPIGGFLWSISDDIKLNAILPVASLDFKIRDDLTVSVIGEYVGFRVHTGDDLDDSSYRDEALKYMELRAGAQVSYEFSDSASLRLSAGWAFRQEFEFEESDDSFRTDGAPFVGISVRKSF